MIIAVANGKDGRVKTTMVTGLALRLQQRMLGTTGTEPRILQDGLSALLREPV
jgi:hypothetical protein